MLTDQCSIPITELELVKGKLAEATKSYAGVLSLELGNVSLHIVLQTKCTTRHRPWKLAAGYALLS